MVDVCGYGKCTLPAPTIHLNGQDRYSHTLLHHLSSVRQATIRAYPMKLKINVMNHTGLNFPD